MRFLHLGDLHLGRSMAGFSLIEDQRLALDRLLEDARKAGAEALVLAGDLYDSKQPSGRAVRLLSDFLTKAVSQGLTVLAVPGNHDSAERVGYTSKLLERAGVVVAPPFDGEVVSYALKDQWGSVRFWLMPYLHAAQVRDLYEDPSIGTNPTEAVARVIERMNVDETERNVLIAHQFVTSGSIEPRRSDSEIFYVGTAGNVDARVFAPFDYVALGHLHAPQSVGRETVRYAGSLLKYSYSEVHDVKSAPLVTLGPKGSYEFNLIPVRPWRDLRQITGPLEKLVSEEVVTNANPEDFLHVILTDEEIPPHALRRLRDVYPNVVGVDVSNTRSQTTSDLAALSARVGELDPFELFEQFFREQNGRELSKEESALVERMMSAEFSQSTAEEGEEQ